MEFNSGFKGLNEKNTLRTKQIIITCIDGIQPSATSTDKPLHRTMRNDSLERGRE